MKFVTWRGVAKLYWLQSAFGAALWLQPIKAAGEQLKYHNYSSLCSLWKGKKVQRQLRYRLFPWITGFEASILLIIFLGLIAKWVLVSGDCDLGTPTLNDIDFSGLVFEYCYAYYNKQLLKLLLVFIFHLWSDNRESVTIAGIQNVKLRIAGFKGLKHGLWLIWRIGIEKHEQILLK